MHNISAMSVQATIDDIAPLYSAATKAGVTYKSLPAIMLWGAPGVGKSQAVRQIGDEISFETGKRVEICDVRLNLFNPIDLRGIPVANNEKTLAVWLKPKIFDMDNSDDVINILFLDELSAAPQSVQAAAFQITLDRMIGEHALPENCIVIAAGNRVTDRSVAYRMPNALANRLRHIEIETDFESWRTWALRSNIHPMVVDFLNYNPANLWQENVDIDQVAFPTPRTWEFVSNYLNLMCGSNATGEEIAGQYQRVAGLVGLGVATEFIGYVKKFRELPNIADIFSGKQVKLPKTMDGLYTLIMAMVRYAVEEEKKDKVNGIREFMLENACQYVAKFPADYQAAFYINLVDEKTLSDKIKQTKQFKAWLQQVKSPVLRARILKGR